MGLEIDPTGAATATSPPQAEPSEAELGAVFNLIMANATSLYQEAFSATQDALQEDDEE